MKRSPTFNKAVKDCIAEAEDYAIGECYRRGIEGIFEPIIWKGQPMGIWLDQEGRQTVPNAPGATWQPLTRRKVSDACLLAYLRAKHPAFREGGKGEEKIGVGLPRTADERRLLERIREYTAALATGNQLPVEQTEQPNT